MNGDNYGVNMIKLSGHGETSKAWNDRARVPSKSLYPLK